MLGAEPEALRNLSGSFRSSAARLDSMAAELEASLRRSGWQGPDATRFLGAWGSVHRRALALLAERCRHSATVLDRQAREQTLASSADATAATGARPGTAVRQGLSVEPGWTAVRVPEPPRVETFATGGLVIGAGFGMLTLDGEVSVADLGDGRSLVTWSDDTSLGLATAIGGSVDVSVDGSVTAVPVAGAEASAAAGLGATVRRSWEVPSPEVAGLLAALAVERASFMATRRSDVPVMAGRAADAVVGFLAGRDPGLGERVGRATTSPPPAHVERLVGVDTSAALRAGAAAGGGVSADTSGGIRLGERAAHDGSARSVVLELDGDLAHRVGGSLTGSLGLPDHAGDTRTSLRIEVPDGPATELHLTTRVEQDGGLTEQRVAVDLHRVVGHPELRWAIGSLRAGDPGAALAHLSTVELPPDAVDVSVIHPDLDRSGGSAGASASVGLGAAVRVHGDVVQIRR